jgi:integrase/recombinase XerD
MGSEKNQLLQGQEDHFQDSEFAQEIDAFLIDCRSRGLSPNTIKIYARELRLFREHLEGVGLTVVTEIDPRHIRAYLILLAEHRKPSGIHITYRTVKTFLRWYEAEVGPAAWRNPILRVKGPKVPRETLDAVDLDAFKALINTCDTRTFYGARDRAILYTLLDTGCRASEFTALNICDLNARHGSLLIQHGKGGKSRTVYIGNTTRKEVLRYLRWRLQAREEDALWTQMGGERLTNDGLRMMIRRRSETAGVERPSLHAFRRAFALLSLRGGMDIYSLQRLMGHETLDVLRRYLAQTEHDLQAAHEKSGPIDHLKDL